MLPGAAKKHRAQFERLVAESGVDVVVRQPAAATASATAADKVFGKAVVAPATGVGTTATVTAVVSDAAMNPFDTTIPPRIAALGRTDSVDVLLRCVLSAVLLKDEERYGRTLFDTAHDVQIGGATFKVKGTDRTGLPPVGPYILWVALRKEN